MKWASAALLLSVCPAFFVQKLTAQNHKEETTASTTACPAGTDFEAAGYTIRNAGVEDPFAFLPWIAPAVREARSQVSQLAGKPYNNLEVKSMGDSVSRMTFLPDAADQRVIVDLLVTSVENCSGKQLDLTYWVLSSQIAPAINATLESAATEKTAPETSAGADAITQRLQIFPAAGYNRTDRLSAGGTLKYLGGARFPIGNFRAQGVGSSSMYKVSAALSGSHSGSGWLAHAQWGLNYQSSSEPSLDTRLGQNRLAAQFSAISRGLGKLQAPLRFGASLEGGNLQSAPATAAGLAPETVVSSGYGAVKLFAGTTARWQRTGDHGLGQATPFNTMAASYGVELGSTDVGGSLDWVKHVADFADDFTLPLGDHRWLELESRLNAGFIQVRGVIPQAARFLGGNRQSPFITGEDWIISGNPFIRSLAANRLAATADGFGGTRFVSFNLTVALTTWRFPLVPSDVTGNDDFKQQLAFALNTSTSALDLGYRTEDPHYRALAGHVGKVRSALAALKTAVTASQPAAPPQASDLYKNCLHALGRADSRAASAQRGNGADQYGLVVALLQGEPREPDPTENWLNKVHEACLTQLNAQVHDQAIAARAGELDALHATMEEDFAAIDRTLSKNRAHGEMKYPRQTLNTLLYQVNLFSLSPVLVFDAAHLGPASSVLGTRYAVGGGARARLISHVEFTLGYAANPKRLPQEGAGALFFSMQLKNVFD